MAVGLKKMGKPSPVKWVVPAIMAVTQLAKTGINIWQGSKRLKGAKEEREKASQAEAAARARYENQQYINPYAGIENPYEDLTVNQQQAQFEAQQGAQSRADILEGLRGTAGAAGVSGLAQVMANQSALGAQRISASIGQQEAMNQRLRAQGAMQTQRMEAAGEAMVAGKEEQRIETLYGMDMSRLTAANQARQQARQQMWSGIGEGLGTIAGGITPGNGGGDLGDFQKLLGEGADMDDFAEWKSQTPDWRKRLRQGGN
jgi:hypothetical protein